MQKVDKIVILDFGSQYTKLIARRIREMHVYTEIMSPEASFDAIRKENPKGIILSGGPNSVNSDAIKIDKKLFELPVPLLGICYGMQLMNRMEGGTVEPHKLGEYGKQKISISSKSKIFAGLSEQEIVWMSHGDSVKELGCCFSPTATSSDGHIAAMEHQTKPRFAVQFHPEVTHTENGSAILNNFLEICGCKREWSIRNFIENKKEEIRGKVKDGRVVSLVSGGVDSTCATLLCLEALGKEKVFPLHIDTGLMRADESAYVLDVLKEHGFENITFVDAKDEFLKQLKGVADPEEKRKIIGNLFIEILEREINKLEHSSATTFFCQGTLYTDLIESGKGCGKNAAVIKTHHNVGPPVVERKRQQGLIIEPNEDIFKDEVRQVCKELNVPKELVWRHPFPGPGLAIRILGEITQERLDLLRRADAIYLEEIKNAGLYDKIWQAFAVLLPVKAVGVMGDQRTTGCACALRAVTSTDGMTADCFAFPPEILSRISTRIINEVAGINRVVYDVTSKPPGTIEWE